MKNKLSIREKLGITQQDLANYLSVSRTLLSLAEKGVRDLPTSALVKLSKLELSNKPFPSAASQKISTTEKKKLQQRAGKCSFHTKKIKKQLSELRQQQQQHTQLFQTLRHLLAALPVGREAAADKLWLEIQQASVLKKMQGSGETAQALLQLKIDLLEYEAKELLKLL